LFFILNNLLAKIQQETSFHHHPRHWTIRRLADPHRREPLHRLPAPALGISLGKYNAGKYNAANIELGFGTQGILNVGYSRKF